MHRHLKGLVPLHNINHQVASPTLHMLSLQAMLNPLAIPSQYPLHSIPPLHKQDIHQIAGTTFMELLIRLTSNPNLPDVGPSHKRPCPGQEPCNTLHPQTILKLHNILTLQLGLLGQLLHIPQTTQRMLATVVLPFQAATTLPRNTIIKPMERNPGITRRQPNTHRKHHMEKQDMPNQHLPVEVRQALHLHPGVVIVTAGMNATGTAATVNDCFSLDF